MNACRKTESVNVVILAFAIDAEGLITAFLGSEVP